MVPMTDAKETRAHAFEIKFVVDAQTGERIRAWARTFLDADPHGTGPFGDEYRTSTLYFDTAEGHVFHRWGSYGRAKYRIRRYEGSDVVFLERKLRRHGMLVKRRTQVALHELKRWDDAGTSLLSSAEWFRRRTAIRALRAVCQVSYHRTARALDTGIGLARLTLDQSLQVAAVSGAQFTSDPGKVILPGLILELKFKSHVPTIFKRLVEDCHLSPQSASKYRLGMASLNGYTLTSHPSLSAVTTGRTEYA
jgi:VTC domain-containing protein